MIKEIIWVGLGSGLGGVARFLSSKWITQWIRIQFPISTFLINIFGSFLIGIFIALSLKEINKQSLFLFLTTGFCGGFTTFSTFSNENLNLLKNGQYQLAFIYIGLSIICGLAATLLGYFIVR